jgi:hypothetical protein
MNRHLTLSLAISIALGIQAIPLRAANKPRAGTARQNTAVWANDDLERLHDLGLICVVGRMNDETPQSASLPGPYVKTQDPDWYAGQAAKLRGELERRQAQLGRYRQALEDARSLRKTSGGIDLGEGDLGITPEAGMEILQQRLSEAQAQLDVLENLARRNDIPPGTLRGQ